MVEKKVVQYERQLAGWRGGGLVVDDSEVDNLPGGMWFLGDMKQSRLGGEMAAVLVKVGEESGFAAIAVSKLGGKAQGGGAEWWGGREGGGLGKDGGPEGMSWCRAGQRRWRGIASVVVRAGAGA